MSRTGRSRLRLLTAACVCASIYHAGAAAPAGNGDYLAPITAAGTSAGLALAVNELQGEQEIVFGPGGVGAGNTLFQRELHLGVQHAYAYLRVRSQTELATGRVAARAEVTEDAVADPDGYAQVLDPNSNANQRLTVQLVGPVPNADQAAQGLETALIGTSTVVEGPELPFHLTKSAYVRVRRLGPGRAADVVLVSITDGVISDDSFYINQYGRVSLGGPGNSYNGTFVVRAQPGDLFEFRVKSEVDGYGTIWSSGIGVSDSGSATASVDGEGKLETFFYPPGTLPTTTIETGGPLPGPPFPEPPPGDPEPPGDPADPADPEPPENPEPPGDPGAPADPGDPEPPGDPGDPGDPEYIPPRPPGYFPPPAGPEPPDGAEPPEIDPPDGSDPPGGYEPPETGHGSVPTGGDGGSGEEPDDYWPDHYGPRGEGGEGGGSDEGDDDWDPDGWDDWDPDAWADANPDY